jgi:hypothetical protein
MKLCDMRGKTTLEGHVIVSVLAAERVVALEWELVEGVL